MNCNLQIKSRKLLRLINDTLEISRYEAGKIKLQVSATNVRSARLSK